MQEFITISNSILAENVFEFFLVGIATYFARGTIIPMFLIIQSLIFICYHSYYKSNISDELALYEQGKTTYEMVMMAYNYYYVMGGLILMGSAMMLAAIKPLQSKIGFVYCIALCMQALSSISLFFNGLEVFGDDGNAIIQLPELTQLYIIHSFINEKMIIITVVTAWISASLSRKVNYVR